LVYGDDVNVVGEKIDTIQRNTKLLLDASEKVGLEANPEKTFVKYVSVKVSEGRTEAEHEASEWVLGKCGKVQISGNNTNRLKLY
jgi:hypothetical protein